MMFARALAASILAASLLTITPACGPASAQTYPSRPVTILVAFPPGGADDATARIIQDPMEKALGQPIVSKMSAAPEASSPPPGSPTRARWLHDPAAPGRAGSRHDALSGTHFRRREGFCADRSHQYDAEYAVRASGPAGEQSR